MFRTLTLTVSRAIDRATTKVGQTVRWLTLLIPVVCVGYALTRKFLRIGHNGFTELQWYLFAAVYLLAAAYTLLSDEHVRVDVLWNRFGVRLKCVVDIAFFIPLAVLSFYLTALYWDFWTVSLSQREGPEDVLIGLERWPVKLALFAGFFLLGLQCLSEVLKRIAILKSWLTPETVYPTKL
jgi:TRAP-type mannitol/chloroaromatic compound transport system permease small subunit